MKVAVVIARYLLALIFIVFGLNGFLQFIPQSPLPDPTANQFLGALVQSHYTYPVFALQFACGVLFLINRYIPLALTLIGPVIVNILLFHTLMAPSGLPPGLVVTVLWFILFYRYRASFAGIFQARPAEHA